MRTVICLLACLTLPACALTTDYVDVPYQSQAVAAPVAGAGDVTVTVKAADARTTYQDRVSSKKNGFGMEMAPIVASNDVIETTRQAIEKELAARGFGISPGGATVTVEVVKFYSDYKIGFWGADAVAEINLNVRIALPDKGLVYSQHYEATGKEPMNQLMGGRNARTALVEGLKNGVNMVVGDPAFIAALLKSGKAHEVSNPPQLVGQNS
jgi:uncharacterized lipoprotein YajG